MTKALSVSRWARWPVLTGIALLLAGCAATGSGPGYYWQGLRGQLGLLQASRPIEQWLQEPDLAPELRARLETARRMRAFSIDELGLPDNASYRSYADLGRPYAVWNLVAAPPHSLELRRWCFPIAGCVGYRGYFDEASARAAAAPLAEQGLETQVYGVPAYSTLGYLNWLGGDPLLSSFIHWNEGDFAGLLFHELAHQVVYVGGDMGFNESFATAVERLATPLWLKHHANPATLALWQAGQQRRSQWQDLTQHTRRALQQLYDSQPGQHPEHTAAPGERAGLEQDKTRIYERFRAGHARLRQQWQQEDAGRPITPAQRLRLTQGQTRLDQWVAQANNASFGALAAYDEWVPAFEALWRQSQPRAGGPDREGWLAFYARVRQLAALPEEQRLAQLCRSMQAHEDLPRRCAPTAAHQERSTDDGD